MAILKCKDMVNDELINRIEEEIFLTYSIVNTNTCTTPMSLIKIYLKFLQNTPTCFGHSTIIREFF